VCKQWRDLALHVKGLRVLVYVCDQPAQQQEPQQGQEQQLQQQQQRTASCCAWLRRHAHQVVALAVIGGHAVEVLATLAQVASSSGGGASAAAGSKAGGGGQWLPLRRLVVLDAFLLPTRVCQDTLQPLMGALPHLQHLHLPLLYGVPPYSIDSQEEAGAAALAALAPLQHSTTLTNLVLSGPMDATEAAHVQLLSSLPGSLRELRWGMVGLEDPQQLSFDHLTALTTLSLHDWSGDMVGCSKEDAFTSLRNLRQLDLRDIPVSDAGLLACKEQLVGLSPRTTTTVLSQLTRLQCLLLTYCNQHTTKELLQQAPPIKRLSVQLQTQASSECTSGNGAWVLQQYKGLTRLEGLQMVVPGPQAAPTELHTLTQLQQLTLGMDTVDVPSAVSWAQALAGLVNLEGLSVPAVLTGCGGPWLTRLTRLALLEVTTSSLLLGDSFDMQAAAAAHISQVLVPGAGSSSCGLTAAAPAGTSASSSSSSGVGQQPTPVAMVCFAGFQDTPQAAAVELYCALVAAVPVLPQGVHLFRGSLVQLQQCGVEMWPAPVAARLQSYR
jgi:hypothetical protein